MFQKFGSLSLAFGALLLAGCVHPAAQNETPPPASVASDGAPRLCAGDARAFVREAEKTVDFEARFRAFDEHIRRFVGGFEIRKRLRADQIDAHDARLLAEAEEAIHLLGRLLPFEMNEAGRPDMADFADRIYFDQIDLPDANDADTVMRIAFAKEALDAYPDAGRRIIRFMTDLDLARNMLEIQISGNATPTEREAVLEMPRIVLETYEEDLRPVFEQAISGPYHADLSSRLAGRISRLCTERALALEIEAKGMTGSKESEHE
jgi:hypothetical protein